MDQTADDSPRPAFPQMRLLAGVSAVVIIVLVAGYFLVLRKDYAVLYSGLRPQEAAAIVQVLEKQGVPYRLAGAGSEIRVPESQLDAAKLDLASSEAPIRGLEGFELFNESDMGLTDFAQKIRYQRALQGELARTIMMMEGVADARVHISMPERSLFRGERRTAEAAVTLVMHSPEAETPARIEGVQRLVAASVPDLLVSDVVVLNARGEVISPRVEIGDTLIRRRQGADADAPSIELVMEIMRGALPNRRFEVTIEPSPAALAGGAEGEVAQARIVTVLTEQRLGDGEMEAVSAALRNAGIVDGDSGGTLAFRIGPPTDFESLAPSVVSASAAPAVPTAAHFNFAPLLPWLGASLLIVLFGIGFAVWLRMSRPALAAPEHERFADQLKAALGARAEERQNV